MTEPLNGVVVVDKPVGPTSFAIVRQARRATGARKVGHGGTLDPLASGVLPICFGEATKLAQFLLDADKEYEATIQFGAETDTYDATGTVTARRPAGHLKASDVHAALQAFQGAQQQIPPMYSALKRAGRPLYEYARAGETVERPPRTVHIHAIELRDFTPAEHAQPGADGDDGSGPRARVFVRCSKGTYVRSLAHDLGCALETGAHLLALRRIRSGPFGLEGAIAPDDLSLPSLPVVALADALRHLPSVMVTDDVALELTQGKPVSWDRVGPARDAAGALATDRDLPVRALSADGNLVAVAFAPREPSEPVRTIRVFRSA